MSLTILKPSLRWTTALGLALLLYAFAAGNVQASFGLLASQTPALSQSTLQLTAGTSHTCVLTPAGGAKCWGDNSSGQLGNGSKSAAPSPGSVAELEGRLTAITAGGFHTCALTQEGSAHCWGRNEFGQLGDGSQSNRMAPVRVQGLNGIVTAMAAGSGHTCAVMEGGSVYCWGHNDSGQLGDGSTTDSNIPVAVEGLGGAAVEIVAGWSHTCALLVEGTVYCWGKNASGQLGDGSTTDHNIAVQVMGLSESTTALAGGAFHNCAITQAGEAYCWGDNAKGQLGDGSTTDSSEPVRVEKIDDSAVSISAGLGHTCVLLQTSDVQCWGDSPAAPLGDGSKSVHGEPVTVEGLPSHLIAIASGGLHSCVLDENKDVYCWGANTFGQLGDESKIARTMPVSTAGLRTTISAIAAGGYHTCALTQAGQVQCWGDNIEGQLGDGSTVNHGTAQEVVGLTNTVRAIATGVYHSCALVEVGAVQCWGSNAFGQLGDGTTTSRSTPVQVVGLESDITAIAAGGGHSCALTAVGTVLCWGDNAAGQLGDGSTTNRAQPTPVSGLSSAVTAIATGDSFTCAITEEGSVYCWGDNADGQLGNGGTGTSAIPVEVVGLSDAVIAVSAGIYHACGLTKSGGVECWGHGGAGQLGNGSQLERSTAVAVPGLERNVTSITAGGWHTCALTRAGGVLCWGNNNQGQLGGLDGPIRLLPMGIIGLGSGVTLVAAGGAHTCALVQADRLSCWGDSSTGQLGDGNFTRFSALATVSGLSNITTVSGGYVHSCALTSTSTVHCWGDNAFGQLGDGTKTTSSRPVTVPELKASAVAAANGYTCAITESARVLCWGYNGLGTLGQHRQTDSTTPVLIEGLVSDVSAIAANKAHVCVLLTTSDVQCWGDNSSGQLGDGNGGEGISSNSPVTVSGLSGVTAITGSSDHTCALTSAGSVLCWGDGESGQLGNGSAGAGVHATTPIQVSGLSSGIHAIAAGGFHTCALTSAGGVLCWGDNTHGQLGDGSNTSRVTPTPVSGLSSGVIAIVAGYLHSCALTQSGSVWCWGANDDFQLGLGEVDEPMRNTPSMAQGLDSGIVALSAGGLHTCAVTQVGEAKCWGANLYAELGIRAPWMPVVVLLQ